MGEKLDPRFGLASFGYILVGTYPTSIFQRLMTYGDKPSITELLKKQSFLAAIDEGLSS